jgi:hypothetical protein
MVKNKFPLSFNNVLNFRDTVFLAMVVTTILVIANPLESHAIQSGIGFYSPNSLPVGTTSLEPLIGKWWNFWINHPPATLTNWPSCLKGDGGVIGENQSVVFLGDPASASPTNANATHQNCGIRSNQLLFLSVYEGACDTGEFPGMTTADLLKCAQDSNKVIKLMQVKVDGTDVSSNIIRQSTSHPFVWVIPPVNTYGFKPPVVGTHPAMGESYYLLFKPMPPGDHTIKLEIIRVPLQANQPTEHDVATWNLKVVP